MTLFLTTFGDGPHWDNILKIPGYPGGFSYERPFRYRDKWVHPEIRERADELEKKLADQSAVLGLRFGAPDVILPIRRVRVRKAELLPDGQSVYFSMHGLFDFTGIDNLADAAIRVDAAHKERIGQSLLFYSDLAPHLEECEHAGQEAESWSKLVRLVATTDLPIAQEAKNAVYLRVEPLVHKAPPWIALLHTSSTQNSWFGQMLAEGESYDLVFHHRVPSLLSTDETVLAYDLSIETNSDNLELSRSREEIGANYGRHELSIAANRPSGTWEQITLCPPAEVISTGGKTLHTASMSVPIKVKLSHRYRFLRTYLWLVLLFLGVAFGNAIGHIIKDNAIGMGLLLGSAAAAVAVTLAVHMLKQTSAR